MKGIFAPVLWGLGMAVVILDSRTAMSGAAEGAMLCIRTLIPGLFPLMVLSSLLASALPRGGLLAAGLLGGYPVGARNAAQAFRSGRISQDQAERMAVVYCCAGPSFLFGVAGDVCPAGLWMVYLCSVMALWLILGRPRDPSGSGEELSLSDALRSSLGAMGQVCGWVILMRTLLAVMDRWILWLLPQWARAAVWGAVELTNGITALEMLEAGSRFVSAAGMIGFGGICVMMQARSVARGLSMKLYFPGKVFQGCTCILLASVFSRAAIPASILAPAAAIGTGCAIFLVKSKKRCGNPTPVGV